MKKLQKLFEEAAQHPSIATWKEKARALHKKNSNNKNMSIKLEKATYYLFDRYSDFETFLNLVGSLNELRVLINHIKNNDRIEKFYIYIDGNGKYSHWGTNSSDYHNTNLGIIDVSKLLASLNQTESITLVKLNIQRSRYSIQVPEDWLIFRDDLCYEDAEIRLKRLNDELFGGYNSWRFPTLNELHEIYTAIHVYKQFKNVSFNKYTFSSEISSEYIETVDLEDNSEHDVQRDYYHYFIPVRTVRIGE